MQKASFTKIFILQTIFYKTLLYIALSLVFNFSIAQNLIPDSSFEHNKVLPTDFSSFNSSYTWSTPSQGTTDLFCKCSLRKTAKYSMVNVPQNPMGYQEAHSGTCYAGFFAHSHGAYREYLQTPLTQTLEKNKTYLLTMYISLSDYSRAAIEQLGVCFLKDKVEYNSYNVISDLKPTYIHLENNIKKEIDEWHQISIKYKAKGTEKYMLIGSFETGQVYKTKFKAPKEIKSHINQKYDRDAYYFVDDVSLVETTPEVEPIVIQEFQPTVTNKINADTLFVLQNLYFETNKKDLLPTSFPELDLLVDFLNKNINLEIEIHGHTDNSGNEKKNKKLSTERAKSVSDYLVSKQISISRITYIGYGSSKPICSNQTEEGKHKNRRVEFILKNKY